jgi:hypothetical protein
MNYESANRELMGKETKKIANNTYLIRLENNVIGLKLHDTVIMEFHLDASIVLNSGGWKTLTTKRRMNTHLENGFRIYQERGEWLVYHLTKPSSYDKPWGYSKIGKFQEKCTIRPNGIVSGLLPIDDKAGKMLQKQINSYVKDFISDLLHGHVPAPNAGDCFYCQMREANTHVPCGEVFKDRDHLTSHMEEKYFVPSLLARAIEIFPISTFAKFALGKLWDTSQPELAEEQLKYFEMDLLKIQATSSLRRYMKRQLGFVS